MNAFSETVEKHARLYFAHNDKSESAMLSECLLVELK